VLQYCKTLLWNTAAVEYLHILLATHLWFAFAMLKQVHFMDRSKCCDRTKDAYAAVKQIYIALATLTIA